MKTKFSGLNEEAKNMVTKASRIIQKVLLDNGLMIEGQEVELSITTPEGDGVKLGQPDEPEVPEGESELEQESQKESDDKYLTTAQKKLPEALRKAILKKAKAKGQTEEAYNPGDITEADITDEDILEFVDISYVEEAGATKNYCETTDVSEMGFSQKASCKAQGFIPRADGTKSKSESFVTESGQELPELSDYVITDLELELLNSGVTENDESIYPEFEALAQEHFVGFNGNVVKECSDHNPSSWLAIAPDTLTVETEDESIIFLPGEIVGACGVELKTIVPRENGTSDFIWTQLPCVPEAIAKGLSRRQRLQLAQVNANFSTQAKLAGTITEAYSDDQKSEIHSKFKGMVNVGSSQLIEYGKTLQKLKTKTPSKVGGLSRQDAGKQGIKSGFDRPKVIARLLDKDKDDWTTNDYREANRTISFLSRNKGNKNPKGLTSQLLWGQKQPGVNKVLSDLQKEAYELDVSDLQNFIDWQQEAEKEEEEEPLITNEKIFDTFKKTDFSTASEEDLVLISQLNATPVDEWEEPNYKQAANIINKYTLQTVEESHTSQLIIKEEVFENAIERDLTGSKVHAVLIVEGLNRRGTHYYSREALESAINGNMFLGIHNYEDHNKPGELPERELKNLIGCVTKVWGEVDNATKLYQVHAIIEIAKESFKELLRSEVSKTIGLSINGAVQYRPDSKGYKYVTAFESMRSVDFVTVAGAGGRVVEVLESFDDFNDIKPIKRRKPKMDKLLQSLKAAIVKESLIGVPAQILPRVETRLATLKTTDYVSESDEQPDFNEVAFKNDISKIVSEETATLESLSKDIKEAAKAEMDEEMKKRFEDMKKKGKAVKGQVEEKYKKMKKTESLDEIGSKQVILQAYSKAIEAFLDGIELDESALESMVDEAFEAYATYQESLTQSGAPSVPASPVVKGESKESYSGFNTSSAVENALRSLNINKGEQ